MSQPTEPVIEQTLDFYYGRLRAIHMLVVEGIPMLKETGVYNPDIEFGVIEALSDVPDWRKERPQ